MLKNKLKVLILAGLILAVTGIGNAYAYDATFTGAMTTQDWGFTVSKPGNIDSTINVYYFDRVGWCNDYYNKVSFAESASFGYYCSEITSMSTSGTSLNPNEEKQVTRYGYLAGNAGDHYVSSLNHIYYGSGTRASDYNAGTMKFIEYR